MVRTFAALGPLGPCCASYSTFAPSGSDLKPSPAMPEWCTNRSLLWSSGVMKPKPFSSLNHFTVPVAMVLSSGVVGCETRRMLGNDGEALALLVPHGCATWKAYRVSRRREDHRLAGQFGSAWIQAQPTEGDGIDSPSRSGPMISWRTAASPR